MLRDTSFKSKGKEEKKNVSIGEKTTYPQYHYMFVFLHVRAATLTLLNPLNGDERI